MVWSVALAYSSAEEAKQALAFEAFSLVTAALRNYNPIRHQRTKTSPLNPGSCLSDYVLYLQRTSGRLVEKAVGDDPYAWIRQEASLKCIELDFEAHHLEAQDGTWAR